MRLRLGVLAVAIAAAVPAAAGGSPSAAKLHLKLIASGLDAPVFAGAPRSEPGKLYVVEQPGVIRVLVNGHLHAQPFLDIRAKVRSGGEQGLLSMAFAPDYATSLTSASGYSTFHTRR